MRVFKGIFILLWGIMILYFIAPITDILTNIINDMFPNLGILATAFIGLVPVIPFIIIAIGVFYTFRGNSEIKGGE